MIIGVMINGINIMTFNIKGIPNTTGSLTPNNPQGNTSFEKALYRLLFEKKNITITNPMVAPHPPKHAKSYKPKLMTFGAICPASTAAVFSARYPKKIGNKIGKTVIDPCTPKNHNNCETRINTKNAGKLPVND